jgi:hypothetical protein
MDPFAPVQAPVLPYKVARGLYDEDRKRIPGFENLTFAEWGNKVNQATGTRMMDNAVQDSWLKGLSHGIDKAIDWTGLPEFTGGAMGLAGSTIGLGEEFQAAGRGLPRAVVDMAPMIAGAMAAPATGGTSLLPTLGIGATAGLTGANTYEKSDSAGLAGLSAITAGLMPWVAGKAGQAGMRSAGATLTDDAGRLIAETGNQRLAGYGAAQAGAYGFQEASYQAGHLATKGELDLSKQHFVESIVGQLPFLAMDVQTGALSPASPRVIQAAKSAKATRDFDASMAGVSLPRGAEDYFSANNDLATTFATMDPNMVAERTRPSQNGVEQPGTSGTPGQVPRQFAEYNGVQYEFLNRGRENGAPIAFLKRLDTGAPYTAPLNDVRLIGEESFAREFTLGGGSEPVYTGPRAVKPPATETLMGERLLPAVISQPSKLLPSTDDLTSVPLGETARVAEVIAPKPTPTPEVVSTVEGLLSEKDARKAFSKINKAYTDILEPLYGVKDVSLARLSDDMLQSRITGFIQEGATLDDAVTMTLQSIQNALDEAVQNRMVNPERVDYARVANPDRLSDSMERLNVLDQRWNELSKEQREALGRSPLEWIIKWREDIVGGNQRYSKYPEVDENVLRAAGSMDWKDGQWYTDKGLPVSPTQAKAFLKKAAQNGYLATVAKEKGGTETVKNSDGAEIVGKTSEIAQSVEELNRGVKDTDDFTYEVEEIKQGNVPTGQARIVKRFNKTTSMFENETGDSGVPLEEADGPPEMFFDSDGQVITRDMLEESVNEVAAVRAESDDNAGDVAAQHMSVLFQRLIDRLGPFEKTVTDMNMRMVGPLVARAKIMVEYLKDKRFSMADETVNWADVWPMMAELPEQFRFQTPKEMADWWNTTGKKFLFGDQGWFSRQPEIVALKEGRKVRDVLDEMDKKEAEKKLATMEKRAGKPLSPLERANMLTRLQQTPINKFAPRMDAIGEGRTAPGSTQRTTAQIQSGPNDIQMSSMDFARQYFQRGGQDKQSAQLYADSVERMLRMVSVFRGAKEANLVASSEAGNPGDLLGLTMGFQLEGAWKSIIELMPKNYTPDTQGAMYGFVAAHEAWHVIEAQAAQGLLPKGENYAFEQINELARSVDPADRLTILREAARALPDGVWSDKLASETTEGFLNYSAQTEREFVSTLAGLYSAAVADGASPKRTATLMDNLVYGDGAVSRFVQTIYRGARGIIGALRGLFSGAKHKMVEDRGLTPEQKVKFDKLYEGFSKLARTPQEVVQAVKTLTNMDAMAPENFLNAVRSGFEPDPGQFSKDKTLREAADVAYAKILKKGDPKEIGPVKGFLYDFMQLAEVHEDLRPYAVEALSYQGLARNAAEDAMSPFFERDYVSGKVVPTKAHKSVQTLAKSPVMRKALNEQIMQEQTEGALLTPERAQEVYRKNGLTQEQSNQMGEVRQAISDANRIVAEQIKRFKRAQLVNTTARVLVAGSDIPYKNALAAAETLTAIQLHAAGVAPLPMGVDPGAMMQSVLGSGIDQGKITVASTMLQELAGKYGQLVKQLSDRPEFVSEQRFGRYAASYAVKGGNKPGRVSADTREELEAKISQLEKDPNNTAFQRFDNSDQHFVGLSPSVATALIDLGKTAFDRSVAVMPTKEAQAAREAFESFETTMEKELTARGIGKWTQNRTLAPGRETIDMLENTMRYLSTVPQALAKTWLKDRANVVALDAKLQQNPSALKLGNQQITNILAPDAQWSRKARDWTFTYYLGANLSSAALEMTQPILTVPAQLVKDGAGVGNAYRTLFKAYAMTAKAYKDKKFESKFVDNMIFRLEKGGLLDAQTTGYFFDAADVGGINLARATEGKLDFKDAAAVASNAVGHVASAAKNLYARAAGLSSRVSAVAATLHAETLISQGKLKPDDAYDYVSRVLTLTAPGTAGRAGRSAGVYNDKWINRSAAGVVGSLQGFTTTMWSMYHRMAKDAVASGSLKSKEAKAFLTLMGTQMMAAGILGLPGVGTALSVVNEWFPEWEVKKNLRQGIAKLGGDDSELGSFYSDVALRGTPSVVSGVDLSARLSLAGLLGVSSYDGFQLKHLFGAPGGILGNLGRAAEQASTGEFGKALESASPTSIKNIVKLFRADGDVRDSTGNLTYQPNVAEQVAMAVGFTPKRLADLREFEQLTRQQDETTRNQLGRFYKEVASLIAGNKLGEARQLLLERERQNPDEFNAAEGLKVAIRKMQDMTMPEDPMRGGSRATMHDRADFARTYDMTNSPTEQVRLQQSMQLRQAFGLYGGLDQSEMVRASMVDMLMQKDRRLSREQARALIDKQFARSRQQLR